MGLSPEMSLYAAGWATLERQLLCTPARKGEVVGAVERICGLNAQTARGPYLSLWNRVASFEKEELSGALYRDRTLIKSWLMRGTVHIVATRDFSVYQRAVGGRLAGRWRQQMEKAGFSLSKGGRRRLQREILDALDERALTKKELLPRIKKSLGGLAEKEQKTRLGYALRELSYLGLVCHGEPTGPWYHFKENRYATVEGWIGDVSAPEVDEGEARKMLLRKYLQGYGPASVHDFAYWAGFSVQESRTVFEALREELTVVIVRGSAHPTWMMKDDLDSLNLGDSDGRVPIRLLPEFDPLIMGHRDKSRIIDEEDRTKVFLPLADVAPTVLIDGRVSGVWNFRVSDASFGLRLFVEDGNQHRSDLRTSIASLQEFFLAE